MKKENVIKIKNALTIALGVFAYWLIVTAIYLIASFTSREWGLTWITFPAAAFLFFLAALVYFNKKTGRRFSLLNWIILTAVISVVIYLLVSFLTTLWAFTWMIFLAMTIAIIIEIMVFLQKKPKENEESNQESNKESED